MDRVIAGVGRELRALREARHTTLAELAEDTGFSASYLGQVENGSAVPSLSILATLAASLGTDATAFFPRNGRTPVHIVRAGDPHKLRIAPNAREEFTVLTAGSPDATFTALTHRVFPGEKLARFRHVGERFALVLEGQVRLLIGDEVYDLAPGDSIHYASHPEHTLEVTSNGPAELLWFTSPAVI